MLTRTLKLKLNKKQTIKAEEYLYILSSVYNWSISKCLNEDRQHWVKLCNSTKGHAKKIEINSQVFQQTIKQAYSSFESYKKGQRGKPKFKSSRNRLKSFAFPQNASIQGNKLKLPDFGLVGFFKQDIPKGKIKQVRLVNTITVNPLVLTMGI